MDQLATRDSSNVLANETNESNDANLSHEVIPSNTTAIGNFHPVIVGQSSIVSGTTMKIEILRDEQDSGRFRLLKWNSDSIQGLEYSMMNAEPSSFSGIESECLRIMSLPNQVLACGQAGDLHREIASTIQKYIKIPYGQVDLIAAYVMATWFSDVRSTAPYLWITGPLDSGKTTLLRILQCMCRRAILVGDITPASLYTLCDRWDATLLLDESEDNKSLENAQFRRLLRSGSVRGVSTFRNGHPFSTFGFKIISCRQLSLDAALTSRGPHVFMLPTSHETKPVDHEAILRITAEFQGKLLRFRMENFSRVSEARLPSELTQNLTSRTRDLAYALVAPIICEPRIANETIARLCQFDQSARVDQTLEPEWLVMKELYALAHQENLQDITVGQLAAAVNRCLESRGEDTTLRPRRVGAVLKTLGIRTRKLGNLGRGLQFGDFLRRQIHQSAALYRIERSDIVSLAAMKPEDGGCRPCRLCDEFKLSGDFRRVPVQGVSPFNSDFPPHRPLRQNDQFDRLRHQYRKA